MNKEFQHRYNWNIFLNIYYRKLLGITYINVMKFKFKLSFSYFFVKLLAVFFHNASLLKADVVLYIDNLCAILFLGFNFFVFFCTKLTFVFDFNILSVEIGVKQFSIFWRVSSVFNLKFFTSNFNSFRRINVQFTVIKCI